ncbi:MAG: phosphoribosylglycinamide formyltransferase [Candidatus Campbellbacteria bacterium]|nr:phosphoribosylglycinamide formyltransferase [Candidatus Campbellbacteria bacterium]
MRNDNKTKDFAVFISGRGSNLEAILKADLRPKVVISSNPDAKGLNIARDYNIPTEVVDGKGFNKKDDFNKELKKVADIYKPNLIVLAGFMKILSADFLLSYPRTINIHPSLLPKFPGLDTHRRVIEAGEKETGVTIHWVDSGIDTGEIIKQVCVKTFPNDTPEALSERVLREEHAIYPCIIREILEKSY